MGTVLTAGLIVAVAGLGLLILGIARRVWKLEQAREVERRHREHITAQVERLEDRAAGVELEPEGEIEAAIATSRPRFPQ